MIPENEAQKTRNLNQIGIPTTRQDAEVQIENQQSNLVDIQVDEACSHHKQKNHPEKIDLEMTMLNLNQSINLGVLDDSPRLISNLKKPK